VAQIENFVIAAGEFPFFRGNAMVAGFPDMGGFWASVFYMREAFGELPSWLQAADQGAWVLTEPGKYIVTANINANWSINTADNPMPTWGTPTGGHDGAPENTPAHPEGMFVIVRNRLIASGFEVIGT
jgi:hypothetical protein